MLNIFLFLSAFFLLTFVVGSLLERIRLPWIFAALLIGSALAVYNPFVDITSSSAFGFLSELGMLFLLFMVGFEISLKEMKRETGFILNATIFIILLEAILSSLVVHFVFGYDWIVSFLVSISFATVGEAILVPILDEFRIIHTRLGQTILGIGVLDDIIEIAALALVIFLVGSQSQGNFSIGLILASLFVLMLLTVGLMKLREEGQKFQFLPIESLFLLTIFVLFLFVGVGTLAEAAPLAALLAGVSLGMFIPKKRLALIKSEVKTLCYGFFAPVFFLSVGATIDIEYILMYPLLLLVVVAASKGAKLLGSLLVAHKRLGTKQSVLLGIGLSVRFSTSIIIIKILFDSGLIGLDLYSVIVSSSIVFNFMVPILFSALLVRWKIALPTLQTT